jgi:hypothetical protein
LWLVVGYSSQGTRPFSGTAEQLATPNAEPISPLLVIAAGSGARPDASSDVVWLVQRGAVAGDQRTEPASFPLGFVLAERGTLVIFDADETRIMELGPGRATLLPAGARGSFGSASGDLVLYVQIALVPVAAVPETLPRGMLASEPFPAEGGAALSLELARGILNPTRAAELPAGATPALLVASESAIQLETATGAVVDIPNGELFLLTEPVTVRNPGHQPATFVIARSALPEHATTQPTDQAGHDPSLDDAWHRFGCHLNPGNPSCLTVGIAAECAIDATGPGCRVDSDGDRCADVAEAEAGFDPFDATDCVGSAGGQPAVNCLFLTENLACNGDRIAEPAQSECAAEREIRQRRSPSSFSGCVGIDRPPVDACVYNARDPGCDGFAREPS